jgi:hypothetical protein
VTLDAANVTVSNRIQDLIGRAQSQTGLDVFGGDSWREGLHVLVTSAETEGTFNDYGQSSFYDSLVRPLVTRLHVEDWYRRFPEIDDQEVEIELLGVGFPRTGSTALSHLLAEDRRFRTLRNWEESAPCPPPGVSPEDDEGPWSSSRSSSSWRRTFRPMRIGSPIATWSRPTCTRNAS